jgi:hypothetical protein
VPDNGRSRPQETGPANITATNGTAILADDRDRRRARTIRRAAAIELVALHYGAVPAERWCTFCHGECRVVSA